jgi:hypothetical protein
MRTSAKPTPAQFVIEHYLAQSLSEPGDSDQLRDLRTDILYLLTDKFAHRRALKLQVLVSELRSVGDAAVVKRDADRGEVRQALELLCRRGLVRDYEGEGEIEYELAHDFMVRSVLKLWQQLDRDRMEQAVFLRHKQEKTEERLVRFESLSNATLKVLPVTTIAVFLWIASIGFWGSLPSWLGLSILWLVISQALLILFVGIVRKISSATVFGLLSILACSAIWLYERSQPMVPMVSPYTLERWLQRSAPIDCGDITARMKSFSSLSSSKAQSLYSSCTQAETSNPATSSSWCVSFADEAYLQGSLNTRSEHDYLAALCTRSLSQSSDIARVPVEVLRATELRPYQKGELTTQVAWIALGAYMFLVALYPKTLLSAAHRLEGSKRYSSVMIIWGHELIEVVLQITVMALMVYVFRQSSGDGTDAFWDVLKGKASWRQVLPASHASFWYSVAAAIGIMSVLSSAFVLWKHSTPAGLFTHVGLDWGRQESRILRIFLRQLCVSVWSCLNAFLLLPALIITPIFLFSRDQRQTLWDWMSGCTEVLPEAIASLFTGASSASAVLHGVKETSTR